MRPPDGMGEPRRPPHDSAPTLEVSIRRPGPGAATPGPVPGAGMLPAAPSPAGIPSAAPSPTAPTGIPPAGIPPAGIPAPADRPGSPDEVGSPRRYQELEVLGAGGFAEVVRARDPFLGREVALKRPHRELQHAGLGDFQDEARATSHLEHPGIPPLYEAGVDADGRPFFALKLVRGWTLEQCIERLRANDPKTHEAYPFHERVAVILKVCEALAYAHEKGVLHRDLKPGNIMVGDLGEVFVLDWGLAKRDEAAAPGDARESGEFFKGTPLYAPPERLAGEPATAQSELYSLGATLYEWLTLHPVFPETDLGKLFKAIMTREPRELPLFSHPIQGRVPIDLSRIVMTTLAKDKARRPASLREFADALRHWLQGDIKPQCPCTTIKFTFAHVSRLLDNHSLWAVPLVVLWLLFPVLVLLQWLIDRYFWHL